MRVVSLIVKVVGTVFSLTEHIKPMRILLKDLPYKTQKEHGGAALKLIMPLQ